MRLVGGKRASPLELAGAGGMFGEFESEDRAEGFGVVFAPAGELHAPPVSGHNTLYERRRRQVTGCRQTA